MALFCRRQSQFLIITCDTPLHANLSVFEAISALSVSDGLIPHLRHSLQTGVRGQGFCQRSLFFITTRDTPLLANRVLRAGHLSGRISDHLAFTPASKGLRGPFTTSHNIYYVKSNMLV